MYANCTVNVYFLRYKTHSLVSGKKKTKFGQEDCVSPEVTLSVWLCEVFTSPLSIHAYDRGVAALHRYCMIIVCSSVLFHKCQLILL